MFEQLISRLNLVANLIKEQCSKILKIEALKFNLVVSRDVKIILTLPHKTVRWTPVADR